MKIIVLKFGGTSVGSTDRIKKVASIIISYVRKNYKVIVTSSAMSGVTNDLVKKSKSIINYKGSDHIAEVAPNYEPEQDIDFNEFLKLFLAL